MSVQCPILSLVLVLFSTTLIAIFGPLRASRVLKTSFRVKKSLRRHFLLIKSSLMLRGH